MRYERKYIYRDKNHYSIYSNLYSLGFSKQYPLRMINSIYYDTFNFELFNSSEAGLCDRTKIRIRWYDNSKKEHLEYKIKEAELGKKIYLNQISNLNNLKKISIICPNYNNKSTRKIPASIYSIYHPNVAISYKRNYFLSACKKTRLTLDCDIKFAKILNYGGHFHINNWTPSENAVLEIKYSQGIDNENIINRLTKKLNLDLSRFSKYCKAVSTVF